MINPLNLLIAVGSLTNGILIAAICREMCKNSKSYKLPVPVPASSNLSPKEISRRMVKSISAGYFRMHILSDEKVPEFDDNAYLAKYREHIRNPATIAYIQSVKGGQEYE